LSSVSDKYSARVKALYKAFSSLAADPASSRTVKALAKDGLTDLQGLLSRVKAVAADLSASSPEVAALYRHLSTPFLDGQLIWLEARLLLLKVMG
jgi:hypothetical protein